MSERRFFNNSKRFNSRGMRFAESCRERENAFSAEFNSVIITMDTVCAVSIFAVVRLLVIRLVSLISLRLISLIGIIIPDAIPRPASAA